MANKDTSKQWFETGDYPTQSQFYQVFDWLRWKDEGITIADVAALQGILDSIQNTLNSVLPNQLISGGNVSIDTDDGTTLSIYVPETKYKLKSASYTQPAGTFNLALRPAAGLFRIDVFYLDATGFHVVTGATSATPVKPGVPDGALELSNILVGFDNEITVADGINVLETNLTGLTDGDGTNLNTSDNILVAFGKVKKFFSDLLTTFNVANKLVKMDSDGKLPAVDGSKLTGIASGGSLPAGGTTNQILKKQSNSDFDAGWGDIPTEVSMKTNFEDFPLTGSDGVAYVAKGTGLIYRYDTVSGTYKVIGGGSGTFYMTFSGTNTYICTNTPAVTSYPKALYAAFTNANTGSSTIQIDSLTALPVKMNGQNLISGNIKAGSVKLLLLSSDSSHYQLQGSTWEPTIPPSGERAVTVKSDGLHSDIVVADRRSLTATTGAQLAAADWSGGSVSLTGQIDETRVYDGYKYFCEGSNLWYRVSIELLVKDYILDTIDDSGGIKTATQMNTLFPSAVKPQIVIGASGMYMYIGSNAWFYFENKITI